MNSIPTVGTGASGVRTSAPIEPAVVSSVSPQAPSVSFPQAPFAALPSPSEPTPAANSFSTVELQAMQSASAAAKVGTSRRGALDNSIILRNVTLFDGEQLHPSPKTVVIRHGVIEEIVDAASDAETLERYGDDIEVANKHGQFVMPALQDGEFHFHLPNQFITEWANIPAGEDEPVRDDQGRIVRPPMGELYRKLVDRGLLKSISPFGFPYGNSVGEISDAPLPLNDMITSMNFGVFTVHDMQSQPSETHLFTRSREFSLERDLSGEELTPEEKLLFQFARNTPRLNTSGNWFIAGDMQYSPAWGTEGTYNIADGWTPEDIRAAVLRRKEYHGAKYIKVYYDDFRRLGSEQPKDRPAIDQETLREIIAASHELGLPVMVHARTVSEGEEALAAGADTLIHTPGDTEITDELLRLAGPDGAPNRLHPEKPAHVVPSLTVLTADTPYNSQDPFVQKYVGQHWNWTKDPEVADEIDTYISPYDTLRLVANFPTGPNDADYGLLFKNVAKLHAHGIPLVAGTDAAGAEPAVPGLTVHYEMALIRAALIEFGGLDPEEAGLEALKTGTIHPTTMLRSDEGTAKSAPFGKLQKGFAGDLLVLEDNPLEEDFRSTLKIRDMYRGGFRVQRKVFRTSPLAARKVVDDLMTEDDGDSPTASQ